PILFATGNFLYHKIYIPRLPTVIRYFNRKGWDGVGLNFRGCSGTPNRILRAYHSGETRDVDFVIQEIASRKQYRRLVLVGFSLGGNVTLKYVGERGSDLPDLLKAAVGVSVPCHLESSSYQLMKGFNQLYLKNFLRDLKAKVRAKEPQYPGAMDYEAAYNARNFIEFDDVCTGPINGFKGAVDYWTKSSCLQFLPNIKIPALLLNARDDSFLSDLCYPVKLAQAHSHLHLEIPKYGGHVGFGPGDQQMDYWSDRRIYEFVEQVLGE
ncbi:MAG: alpha/beta fold hydrolase, partial [Bacteroidota bacterium]